MAKAAEGESEGPRFEPLWDHQNHVSIGHILTKKFF